MPAARTSAGSAPWIGRPSNTMRPRVGASRPETARSVDVLPAPLAPITQTSSPGYTTRSRPRRTATGPYAAWRSSRLSNGARSDTAIDGPQVGADDVRVRLDRGGRALRDHAAVGQHDHGVRDGHDHPHVVLDQEDGGALVTDSTDQVGHRRLLGGGHAGAGLVEEEEPWPGPERHRQLHEPLLPVRELARRAHDGGEHEVVRDVHADRSEEHTSELQSRQYLVCRLLLEKKNKKLSRTLSL